MEVGDWDEEEDDVRGVGRWSEVGVDGVGGCNCVGRWLVWWLIVSDVLG